MRHLFVLTLIFLMVASACKKNQISDFPNVNVDQYVYLNNPSTFDLNAPGGWIYETGGFKGIVVVRRFVNNDQDDFAAFDRACPEHYDQDCSRLEVSGDDLFMKCSCNGEKYLLFDGSPSDGASLGMKQYRTTFNNNVLHISN